LLRYLNADTAAQLRALAAPQLGFNYLGRFAAASGADWSAAAEGAGLSGGSDAAMPLSHALALDALTLDAAAGPGLIARWSFAPALPPEAEGGALAEGCFAALTALARHAAQPGAGGRSPSDLPLVALSQDEIEGLERHYPRIADVLPLS